MIQFFILVTLFFLSCNNANQLAKQGIEYLEKGQKVIALDYFTKALKLDSDNPIASYGKGHLLVQQPITREIGHRLLLSALPALTLPYLNQAILDLSEYYQSKNQIDKAIELLELRIKNKPSHEIILTLAKAKIKKNDFQEAEKILNRGKQIYSDSVDIKSTLLQVLILNKKKYSEAFKIADEIYATKKNDPTFLLLYAKLAYLTNKKEVSMNTVKILEQFSKTNKENKWRKLTKVISQNRWHFSIP